MKTKKKDIAHSYNELLHDQIGRGKYLPFVVVLLKKLKYICCERWTIFYLFIYLVIYMIIIPNIVFQFKICLQFAIKAIFVPAPPPYLQYHINYKQIR